MAQEFDFDDSSTGDVRALESGAALGLALAVASRDKADAFLDAQTDVARLQAEDMRREDAIRHWSLRVHHISDVLKLTFELALALILAAIVLLITATAWSAAHEDGLVIEAFSVPPDLAAKGLTGQAIAAKLQDKLAAMQAATDSARPSTSYSNNWGNDIKVQIPDTGVSVGEFYRMLVMWFGHQSHITGEVYRTKDGLAVSVRASGDGGDTVTGTEDNIDALAQAAAEKIYARTQPYRYAIFLSFHGKTAESLATLQHLVATAPSPIEQGWDHVGISTLTNFTGDARGAIPDQRRAAEIIPGFALPLSNLDYLNAAIGHDEEALASAREAVRLLPDDPNIVERARAITLEGEEADVAEYVGDYEDALRHERAGIVLPDYSGVVESMRENSGLVLARMHDIPEAREVARDLPETPDPFTKDARQELDFSLAYEAGAWRTVVTGGAVLSAAYDAAARAHAFNPTLFQYPPDTTLWPYMAWAKAELGDEAGAAQLISRTRLDCYLCLRVRARLAVRDGDVRKANTWFAQATAFAPSVPFAWSEWGEMLLRKGDLDGAIAKFTIANQKGPHFADPLELWGEALIAKNRSDLALAKLEEAAKYAPNWGRLHLKWGEALLWSGDKDGARKQFQVASGLDLTAAERSELMRASHG
jgi:tetratricopeptide (TPR) repeat protein